MWLEHLATAGLTVFVYMTAIWLLSLVLRNASIIDIFWGLGFVLLAWEYWLLADGFSWRQGLVLALVSAWGVRLSAYIAIRNHGRGEDKRYARWRREGGKHWWLRSYVTVFLLQGALMLIVSTPLYLAQHAPAPDHLSLIEILAGMIAASGFLFEAIADWQLYRFKSNSANQGKVFDRGLWRFSRHPNYFGEMLVWWGLFGLAVGVPYGWIGLISPVIMTVFLLKVSGVTLLERDLKESKPAYRNYINTTNAFIPWVPKSS